MRSLVLVDFRSPQNHREAARADSGPYEYRTDNSGPFAVVEFFPDGRTPREVLTGTLGECRLYMRRDEEQSR